MGKNRLDRRIVNRIAKQLSKSRNPLLIVSEVYRIPYGKKCVVDSPDKAAKCFANIADKKQEHFAVLTLDGARQAINCHIVTVGTLTQSLVHPREVFALAIEDRAASIIIAHNHPSGDLSVSEHDKKVTGIIREAGQIMNIPLDDHIIVSGGEFASAFH